MFKNFHNSLNS